jgi:hypothetical protein
MQRLAAIACALGTLAACQSGKGKSEPKSDPDPKPVAEPAVTATPGANGLLPAPGADMPLPWFAQPNPCPDDAGLVGTPPPRGNEVWCARPDGAKHGRATKYGKLGNVVAEGEHRDGHKHGTFTTYHQNGHKATQVEFVDGLENGPVTMWHRNGQKALEGTFEQGKGSGPWTKWDEEGNLVGQGTYGDSDPP